MRTGEWNFSPAGDTSITRLARASRSMKGGGYATAESGVYLQQDRNVLTNVTQHVCYLHCILVGCCTAAGGMITLMPQWRCPVMAPPRASTRKLTRKPACIV